MKLAHDNVVNDVLGQKLELLRQFCDLTELILQALDDEDMHKLSDLLGARQGVIDQVDDLNSRLVSHGFDITAGNIKLCGGQTGQTQQIMAEIKVCLAKAQDMDRHVHTIIQQRYRDLTKNVSAVRVAREAETMYRKKAVSRYGYFVDKKK